MTENLKKQILLSSILVLLSLLIAFALGELMLRVLGYQGVPMSTISNVIEVDDPILNWRIAPNSERREGRLVYQFNSEGFRDTDHETRNDNGRKRIIVLGDSVTVGYGVAGEDIFSSVLQQRLGNDVEVINISAGGLNTPQETHLFELEGIKYKPEMVILNFILNDCDFYSNRAGGQEYRENKDAQIDLLGGISINPKLKRLLKSSALVYFVKSQLENIKGRITGDMATSHDYFHRIWSEDKNRKKIIDGFSALANLGSEHDFETVVVIWPILTDFEDYQYTEIHEWVEQQAAANDFRVIDLLPAFSPNSFRDLQVTAEDNVHPNARGHELAVTELIDKLSL